MKIAICDDEKEQLDEISVYIREHPAVQSVTLYSLASRIIEDYHAGIRFDLIFMDILMGELNGFDAAKALGEEFPEERPRVAFLTITEQYARLGYGIGIWDYISKPAGKLRIFEVIDRAKREIEQQSGLFFITGASIKIDYKDILCVESNYGHIIIRTTGGGTHETILSFIDVLRQLPSGMFFQSHRCYLVNLFHVSGFKKSTVFLTDGVNVPLSRNRQHAFSESLLGFLRRGGHV